GPAGRWVWRSAEPGAQRIRSASAGSAWWVWWPAAAGSAWWVWWPAAAGSAWWVWWPAAAGSAWWVWWPAAARRPRRLRPAPAHAASDRRVRLGVERVQGERRHAHPRPARLA